MMTSLTSISDIDPQEPTTKIEKPVLPILLAIALSHGLNDTMQSVIPAIYPYVKESFQLSFAQIGLITFTFQSTASLLQPFVGIYTDRRPMPYSLAVGMGFTLLGLLLLSVAAHFGTVLLSVALIGMGSSVFHPEASRIAYLASGGKRGFAQSIFQVGGNIGTSLGPILAAFVVLPFGQSHIAWFSIIALSAMVILWSVGTWYKQKIACQKAKSTVPILPESPVKSRQKIGIAIAILLTLMFSKFLYMASMSSYLTFYLMDKFHISAQLTLFHLFLFLISVAIGTLIGGPIGDRIGRKYVIWVSILGVAPFTLILPYANLFWTDILIVPIGVILASAFPAIIVYAQELLPGKIGLISGLFFGLAFGMSGVGSAILGLLADHTNIQFVYLVCSFLPLLGLLTAFLPHIDRKAT